MPAPAFTVGFRSVETEYSEYDLPVEGTIPDWLSGRLVRNGPGKFEVDGRRFRHWFDGLAMVRSYTFDDGVTYSNRFLRTDAYREAADGRLSGQFATDESGLGKLSRWARALGPPEPTDNANVHVTRIDGEYVAQTEVPRWQTFDPETLERTGEFTFRDTFDPDMISAHLVADPRGELVGHALSFGRTHRYHVFRIPDGTRRREVVASIETDSPAYVHSLPVTRDHAVLVETPLRIDIRKALSPFSEGFFELLDWQPDRGTRFHVIDRETGAVTEHSTTAPFFTLHTVNAFDDGEEIVVDLVTFEDDTIVSALSFDSLEREGFDAAPPGRFVRYRIGPDGQLTSRQLYDGGIELPTVPSDHETHLYRYAYAQATDRRGANGLVKVDTERGRAMEWWETDLYVEEPRFVPRPDGTDEDDGVILAPALDVAAEHSWLLVFDAETVTELARARLPHVEPFGFHGRFFRL
ncbi:carotenoid oxygenase family protein [Halovenus marina]|uniref:carotenoid oxygenase family protein n=1 Tax=Halovenus marina TaxID=3396621 RepID=UPI003F572FFE